MTDRSHPCRSCAVAAVAAAVLLGGCAAFAPSSSSSTSPASPASPRAGAAKANVWTPAMEARRRALEAATADSGIAVLRTRNDELQANVPSDFSFDTDSAALKPKMETVLDAFAAGLEQPSLSHLRILVVGHTDSVGPDAVNDPLSLARAVAVARYLESRGIERSRIRVDGRGERQPMIANDMAATRALNRRVEMVLSEPAR